MRERIISEIKRLATENGGRPPEQDTFSRETAISEAQWRGRFWARWSDALKEAGFEPNLPNPKTPDDLLLRKLAEAHRHYGKVPSSAELRLYRNIDPTCPVHGTFERRFPSKAEMTEALRGWLDASAEFGDVIAMLPPRQTNARSPSRQVQDGYVYLLRSGAFYKIGKSEELERRIKEIRVALPEATSLEHSIRTDDPSGVEAYWHRRFADRRANGEWFKLTGADVFAFKRRKFQ